MDIKNEYKQKLEKAIQKRNEMFNNKYYQFYQKNNENNKQILAELFKRLQSSDLYAKCREIVYDATDFNEDLMYSKLYEVEDYLDNNYKIEYYKQCLFNIDLNYLAQDCFLQIKLENKEQYDQCKNKANEIFFKCYNDQIPSILEKNKDKDIQYVKKVILKDELEDNKQQAKSIDQKILVQNELQGYQIDKK